MLLYMSAVAIGFFLLVKGSDYFVDGTAGIASRFGIPQLIIGLTIVAMGTSAPEAAVSITAAFKGNADITVGNIVGSNIINVLIILGIASAIIPVSVQKSTARIELPYMIVISGILFLLGADRQINWLDALVLIVLFLVYLGYLFVSAKNSKEIIEKSGNPQKLGVQILYALGGIAAVIAGSKLAVYGATGIAQMLGISERVIGLTIVALGTSLPELFTSVIAAKKGNADIAIGNIIGSNIFNILFVIGITGMITQIPYASRFMVDSMVMILSGVVLFLFVLKNKRLGRAAGISMIVMYAAYFIYLSITM